MKNVQTFNNQDDKYLKNLFAKDKLPEIDVKDKVMDYIESRKCIVSRRFNRRLVVAVSLILLILFVGFTSYTILDLKDQNGNVFSFFTVEDDLKIDASKFNADYKKLNPGESLAILRVSNGRSEINLLYKPNKFKDIKEIEDIVGEKLVVPSYMTPGFNFLNGSVSFKYDEYTKELHDKIKKSDSEYTTKVLKPTKEINGIELSYQKKDTEISFCKNIDYGSDKIASLNSAKNIEKIKMKNFEAVYYESEYFSELTWLKKNENNKYDQYCVRSSTITENIKEELIKIGNSVD